MFDSFSHLVFSARNRRVSALTSLLLLFASVGLPAYAQQPQTTANVPSNATNFSSAETEYTLGAGDRIRISVFQVEELSGEYLVLVDGTISFPWIGSVKVEGLTIPQLSAVLSQRYAEYVKRPNVTASLLAPRPLKVAISGEVNSPGSYTMTLEKTGKFPSVTDLIQEAGGITATADVGQVQIRRFFQGKQQVLTLNMWELLQEGNQGQNVTLRDGDSIIIPTKDQSDPIELRQLSDANFGLQADRELNVAIVGEVARPGSYKLSPEKRETGSTTKIEPPRLSNAIQLAGGIKPLADVRRIEVRRFTRQGTEQTIAVDLWELLQTGNIDRDVILQDGDTIVIPTAQALDPKESESLAAASFSPETIRVNVVGEVKKPGVVEIPPNTPLNQALLAAGGFDTNRAETDKVELIRLNPDGTVSKREVRIDFSRGIDEESNPTLQNNDVVVVDRSAFTSATDTLGNVLAPFGSVFGFIRIFGL